MSSVMSANVVLMEYADFGIYKRESPCLFEVEGTYKDSKKRSNPMKVPNPMKKVNSRLHIINQIYKDVRKVILHLENCGEMCDTRVIVYGKGLGAHFALYTATELRFKF
mmetsp:Transcript_30197/g.34570  ORF Transcript_30197/g.34570 Transcript_30197/m.34570 type:complete len:109 (+) Transcript_30197:469-795(+)